MFAVHSGARRTLCWNALILSLLCFYVLQICDAGVNADNNLPPVMQLLLNNFDCYQLVNHTESDPTGPRVDLTGQTERGCTN